MKLSLVCERKNFVDEMNKKVAVGGRSLGGVGGVDPNPICRSRRLI
jgi:hypothetical protein